MRRSDRIYAAVAFAAPFVIYALSSSQSVGFWDMAEMATVSDLFGIAHPTCFPAFVIAGWIATHAIPFETVAWRATLVSCAGASLSALALWIALRALDCPRASALAFAWLFAFGEVVWKHATRVEVHALELGFETFALACAVVFARNHNRRWAIAALVSAGFALATHPNALWTAAGTVLIVAFAQRRWNAASAGTAALALCAPLLLYLYILPRSMWLQAHRVDPTLAIGVPPGQPFWNYGNPSTIASFLWMVTARQWGTQAQGSLLSALDPRHVLPAFSSFAHLAAANHSWLFLLLAAAGLAFVARRVPAAAVGLAVAMAAVVAFAHAYKIENDTPRYLMAALWIEMLFAGAAIAWVGQSRPLRIAAAVLLFAAAGHTFWQNRYVFAQRSDPGALPFIARVKAETGRHDIIVAGWTYVTPLGYATYVLHDFGARIPVNAEPPEWDWLIRQLAASGRADIILDRPVAIAGVRMTPLDRDSPGIYRLRISRPEINPGRSLPSREPR
jgi:hypothetical protein